MHSQSKELASNEFNCRQLVEFWGTATSFAAGRSESGPQVHAVTQGGELRVGAYPTNREFGWHMTSRPINHLTNDGSQTKNFFSEISIPFDLNLCPSRININALCKKPPC